MTGSARGRLERKVLPLEGKADAETGTIEGYGSVFGIVDRGGDVVAAGAFAESLAQRKAAGDPLPMLWRHDPGDVRGVWDEAVEDARGLKLKGRVAIETTAGRDAAALLRMGAIKGLSIGYRTVAADFDEKSGVRTIRSAELWEVSLVTFPMNPEAQVASMKSVEDIDAMSETDLERWIREEYGVPRREAKGLIHRLKSLGAQRQAEDLEAIRTMSALDGLLARIRARS